MLITCAMSRGIVQLCFRSYIYMIINFPRYSSSLSLVDFEHHLLHNKLPKNSIFHRRKKPLVN